MRAIGQSHFTVADATPTNASPVLWTLETLIFDECQIKKINDTWRVPAF
jgi:hypothetical protein